MISKTVITEGPCGEACTTWPWTQQRKPLKDLALLETAKQLSSGQIKAPSTLATNGSADVTRTILVAAQVKVIRGMLVSLDQNITL